MYLFTYIEKEYLFLIYIPCIYIYTHTQIYFTHIASYIEWQVCTYIPALLRYN